MRALLESLVGRREALVARSARQRSELASAAAGVARAAAEPLVLGLGAGLALAGSSPKLRAWLVRAWVAAAFLRRLLR
jgi:hypothetical protein